MRFEPSNFFSSENLEFVFSHSVLKPPLIVFLNPLHILGPRRHFESCNRFPWKATLTSVGFPHAICGLRASREDSSLEWVKVEGTVDDAGVPSRGVHRHVLFLL